MKTKPSEIHHSAEDAALTGMDKSAYSCIRLATTGTMGWPPSPVGDASAATSRLLKLNRMFRRPSKSSGPVASVC